MPVADPVDVTRLSPAQLRAIWAIGRRMGWDDERVHREAAEYLYRTERTGTDRTDGTNGGGKLPAVRISRITRHQAKDLIDWFRILAGQPASEGYHTPRMAVTARGELKEYGTPAEQAKLRALAAEMGKDQGWLDRFAVAWLRNVEKNLPRAVVVRGADDLTPGETRRFIVRVEQMARAKREREEAEARQGELFGAGTEDGRARTDTDGHEEDQ